jgi:AbrB family looped-hinge helix DNA binding protein
MTSKGQITIPMEIRKALGLVEGDRIEVQLEAGTVCLRRAESVIARTAGIFAHAGPPRSVEEMREAAEVAIALEAEARSRP